MLAGRIMCTFKSLVKMTAFPIFLPDFCGKNKLVLLLESGIAKTSQFYSHCLSTEEAGWFMECLQEAFLSLILAH